MKKNGIHVGKGTIKDGKFVPAVSYRNVSQRIAAKNNPKRKYIRKGLTK